MTCLSVVLVLAFVLSPWLSRIQAQCDDLTYSTRRDRAKEIIHSLQKDGVLAVRLEGFGKQLAEIERRLAAEDMTPKSVKALEEKRAYYLQERQRDFRLYKRAFEEHFNFSRIAFYYDFNQELIDQSNAPIWLDSSGVGERRPDVSGHVALILAEGLTPESGLHAFLVRNKEFQPVCPPLPQYFRKNRFTTLWYFGERAREKKAEKLVQDVQNALEMTSKRIR